MSNTQNSGYDSQNLTEVLKYIKKEHKENFLAWDERMNSLFGDYAPELREERMVLRRMMQRDLLKKFAQADGQNADKKNRVLRESEMCLVQEEFLTSDKAKYYIQALSDVYGWGLKVQTATGNAKCSFKDADVKKMADKFRKVVSDAPQKQMIWLDEKEMFSSLGDHAPELKSHFSILKWIYQAANMDLVSMVKNLKNTAGVNQTELRMQVNTIQMKLNKIGIDENAVVYIIAAILESFQIAYKDYLVLNPQPKASGSSNSGSTGTSAGSGKSSGTTSSGASTTRTGSGTAGNASGTSAGTGRSSQQSNKASSTQSSGQRSQTQNVQNQTRGIPTYVKPAKKRKKLLLILLILFMVFDFFVMRFMTGGFDKKEDDRRQEETVEQSYVEEVVEEVTEAPTPTPSGPDYDYNPETTGITEGFDIDLGSSSQEQPYRMNVIEKNRYLSFVGYDKFCFKYPKSVYTSTDFVNNGQGADIQITFTSKHEASSMFVQSISLKESGYSGALAEIKNQIKEEESAKMTNVSVIEDTTDMSECRFYISGYEASTGLYMYDAVTVTENRIYRMVIKFPSGELDPVRFYYAEVMYRFCEFTGGGVQEALTYKDYCKKHGYSDELTFMAGGVPR